MTRSISQRQRKLLVFCASLLIFTLICGILYWARTVLIPVAVAFLLTFLLSPLVTKLDRLGLGRVLSVILVVGWVGVFLTSIFWVVASEVQQLAYDLPAYQKTFVTKIRTLREDADSGLLGRLRSTLEDVAKEIRSTPNTAKQGEEEPKPLLRNPMLVKVVGEEKNENLFSSTLEPFLAFSPLLDTLATTGLALLLLIFMLIKREDLRNRLISFTAPTSITVTTKAMDDAAQRVSRFLFLQLIINGSFGLFIGIGLWLIGVPYAALWGLCAGVFRYIPYIGPWIAALLPLTLTLIIFPGWSQFLLTFGLFVVLELLSNNILETILYGQGTGVSEVALLVAATFWTVIWGPMGLILAMPLTVCLVVLGKYVPALNFLDRILGDEPALAPHVTLVQRILAKDNHEAKEIIEGHCQTQPQALYDNVLIPALTLVRRERLRNHMSAEEEDLVFQTIQEILRCADANPAVQQGNPPATAAPATPLATSSPPPALPAAPAPQPLVPPRLVLGCPAHHEADELTLNMLARYLKPHGLEVDVLSTRALPSDIINRVAKEQPALVFVAIQPPGGLAQAQFFCEQLRQRFPDLGILVGVWGHTRDLDNLIVKFRTAGANYVTTTFQGALSHAVSLIAQAPAEASQADPSSADASSPSPNGVPLATAGTGV